MIALRRWCSVIAAAVFLCALSSDAQQTVQIIGWMTDTVSGWRGANSLHAEAAKRKVASGKAKYAFCDERTRRLYVLADQQAAEQYLGQHLQATGTLSFDAAQNTTVLTISTVAPAPAPRTTR